MKPSILLRLGFLLALVGGLPACTNANPAGEQEAIATSGIQELNVYNWDTYIDPTVLDDFERRYGIQVNYSTFASNDELLAVLDSDPQNLARYDIIVPSNFSIDALRFKNRLALLDKQNIPNLNNLDPLFLNPSFDPGNRYCVPYQWGTMGIGYNATTTGREIHSWADFFEIGKEKRIAMLNDMRLSMGVVLLYLGYSPNTSNPAEIAAARDFLLAQGAQIGAYHNDNGQDLLLEGQFDAVYEWSGDVFQVIAENPALYYVIPEEGSIIWNDSLCILANAPNKKNAELLINYLLDPRVGAAISNFTRFASPNLAARSQINPEDRKNPAIYPPEEVQNRLFFLADLDDPVYMLYQTAWQEVLEAATR